MKRLPPPPYSRLTTDERGANGLVIMAPDAWQRAERLTQFGASTRRKLAILPPGKTPGDFDWSCFKGFDVRLETVGVGEGERALAVALVLAGARMVLITDTDPGPQSKPMEVFRPRAMEAAA